MQPHQPRPRQPGPERALTPGTVARLFSVDPKTVTRWAKEGKLSFILTPGGHRRYPENQFREFLRPTKRRPTPPTTAQGR